MIWQGDERGNSQGGNNNAYCQDNETSWIDWTPSAQRRELTDFVAKLIAFRKAHKVFTGTKPFQYIDYLGIGHPDVSLHGAEAWNPDLGPFSHSIGLAFCENYADNSTREDARRFPAFTYLAINMYWKELTLALPKLPPHYVWKVFMDTSVPGGFLDRPLTPKDQHMLETAPRSVRILRAVFDPETFRAEKAQERLDRLPPAGLLKKESRRSAASGKAGVGEKRVVPGLSQRRKKRRAGSSLASRYRR
jgi:glycogen operon protein